MSRNNFYYRYHRYGGRNVFQLIYRLPSLPSLAPLPVRSHAFTIVVCNLPNDLFFERKLRITELEVSLVVKLGQRRAVWVVALEVHVMCFGLVCRIAYRTNRLVWSAHGQLMLCLTITYRTPRTHTLCSFFPYSHTRELFRALSEYEIPVNISA